MEDRNNLPCNPDAISYFYTVDTRYDTCFLRRCATCDWAEAWGSSREDGNIVLHCGAGADVDADVCEIYEPVGMKEDE